MERITIEGRQEQPAPAAPRRSRALSFLGWTLNTILVGALVIIVAWIIGTEAGWIETVYTRNPAAPPAQEAPTARPVATAVIPAPQQAEPPAQVQAEQDGSVPVAQPVQPAIVEQPAPVVPTVYVPPAEPIVQPTPDAWYQGTIRDYADRDPCSMPRANPATCKDGVPPMPGPDGRAP